MEKIENPPRANYLMGSMRFMGYSFCDAVADVIDNSISAGAKNIKVLFPKTPDESPFVGIMDDGHGMSDKELLSAMCYGSQSNEKVRAENDLGRFGLGMKSASLSQCKKMTVVSRKKNKVNAYRWDYDEVSKNVNEGKWYVLKLSEDEIAELPCYEEFREMKSDGTLVTWEDFDVIRKANGGQIFQPLTKHRDELLEHLALIYHRFMKEDKIKFFVNFAEISPLDPFLESRSTLSHSTIKQPLKDSYGKDHFIQITPYKLPFVTSMSNEEQKLIGGADNMNKMQGYYIYRGKRLIKYGTWFGLARHEVSKYGRVKVDIPNSMDDIWKVDVMKKSATIPAELAKLLEKTIADLIDKSTKQTEFRGRKVTKDKEKQIYVWDRLEARKGFYSYSINRDNYFIQAVLQGLPDDQKSKVEMMLREIERNIPIHQMHLDHDVNKIDPKSDEEDISELFEQAVMAVEWQHVMGKGYQEAVNSILTAEQFRNREDLKNKLNKKYNL